MCTETGSTSLVWNWFV